MLISRCFVLAQRQRTLVSFILPLFIVAAMAPVAFHLSRAHADSECVGISATDGTETVITISTVGTCNWTPPSGVTQVDVLIVGGGGGGGGGGEILIAGGGRARTAGGGGGGGFVTFANDVAIDSSVLITIGAGGAGGFVPVGFAATAGNRGGQSAFGALISLGGHGGGMGDLNNETRLSGDGGGSQRDINGTITSTTGGSNVWDGAGGGGGAGGNGSDGTDLPSLGGIGGNGGNGFSSSISGTPFMYGGGGGGGGVWNGLEEAAADGSGGAGGNGGGGRGTLLPASPAVAGVDGTGGGGGGGGHTDNSASTAGARGGDGIVIIRFVTPIMETPPTTIPPQPIPASPLPAGGAAMVVGDQSVVVTQKPEARGRGLTFNAGPIELSIRADAPNSSSLPLTPKNELVASQSGQLLIGSSGVESGSVVSFTLFSNPIRLGETTANSAGNFSAAVSIPNGVPAGNHTLRVQGIANGGQVFVLDIGVFVKSADAALGAHPLISAARKSIRGTRMIQVTVRGVQKSCSVTVRVSGQRVRTTASKTGRAIVRIPTTTSNSKLRGTIKASVSGKKCDKVTVSRRYR